MSLYQGFIMSKDTSIVSPSPPSKLSAAAATVAAKAPKAAPPFAGAVRTTVYRCLPTELAIMGGLDLPEAQRGPLDTATDKAHPLYDERLKLKLTPEWVGNIRANGVKEMVRAVKIGSIPFLINGRQRVRAARVANAELQKEGKPLISVTVELVEADDLAMLADMVITNIHQEDSTATKIAKLQRLMARGVTVEDAASMFAIKTATAKAWLAYDTSAVKAVKDAVNSGKIPSTTGMDIARLPADKQEGVLADIMKVAKDPSTAPTRGGNASRAARIIEGAKAPGESPGIKDRKTMKRFLEAVEAVKHPDKVSPATLEWYSGVEAALHLILGSDGADARLVKLLHALDSAPIEAEAPKAPEAKAKAKKAPKAAPSPATDTDTE